MTRTRTRLAAFATVTALTGLVAAGSAPAAITPTDSADEVAQAIVADLSTLNLATTEWQERPIGSSGPAVTGGIANSTLGGFPTNGTDFGLLTTGDPELADDANEAEDSGVGVEVESNGPVRGDTDYDVTVLRIGVNVPAAANCLSLDYRFLSDEFPEFVGSQFNDAFIGEIDTTQWSTSGSTINKPGDFATNTGGEPVSINGVGPVSVSAPEAAGTTYDAATGLVNTKTAISPGQHLVYLSIFDQGDPIYDSAVFLDRLAFVNEDPRTCRPPEVPEVPAPAPQPGPPAPPPPPSNTFTVGSSITFGSNGTATVTVTVPGPGVVTATDAAAAGASRIARAGATTAATRKKKALIRKTTVIATKAGKVKLKIKPSPAGMKVLRRKGRLKVKVNLTYRPTNGTPRTQAKRLTLKLKRKKRR